jgi:GNAT superfamily N-acetyltransferase
LGVDKEFGGKGVGKELMDFIKSWILDSSNKAASRFLTVDAYNNDRTVKFYETIGFKTIFSSDSQEKEYIGLPREKELKTRFMYFDLMTT